MGFEPTIPAFERAKTVHASDRAATVIVHYLIVKNAKVRGWLSLQWYNVDRLTDNVVISNAYGK
jgi:hypothetical protein